MDNKWPASRKQQQDDNTYVQSGLGTQFVLITLDLVDSIIHSIFPKYSYRHAQQNNTNPDQTAPIGVYTVCHFVTTFQIHHPAVKYACSNFRSGMVEGNRVNSLYNFATDI